jgi:hypothetical protein
MRWLFRVSSERPYDAYVVPPVPTSIAAEEGPDGVDGLADPPRARAESSNENTEQVIRRPARRGLSGLAQAESDFLVAREGRRLKQHKPRPAIPTNVSDAGSGRR